MKKFLVSINKKFTKECVRYVEVEAADWVYAVHTAFHMYPEYRGNNVGTQYWGEAIELENENETH